MPFGVARRRAIGDKESCQVAGLSLSLFCHCRHSSRRTIGKRSHMGKVVFLQRIFLKKWLCNLESQNVLNLLFAHDEQYDNHFSH